MTDVITSETKNKFIQILTDSDEHKIIEDAALIECRSKSNFVKFHAIQAALKIHQKTKEANQKREKDIVTALHL